MNISNVVDPEGGAAKTTNTTNPACALFMSGAWYQLLIRIYRMPDMVYAAVTIPVNIPANILVNTRKL